MQAPFVQEGQSLLRIAETQVCVLQDEMDEV